MKNIGKNINIAISNLKKNNIVVIPTETVYGLGANALSKKAIKKIFKLKNRPSNNPLICHTNSIEKISNFVKKIPEKAKILGLKYWPGPLTIIFEKKNIIPDITTSNLKTVGFRIPNNKITLKILQKLDFPIAAPSANMFSYISPTKTDHVIQNFKNGINYILEDGKCSLGIESTIIGFKKNRSIIYRLGSLTIEEIEKTIGKVEYKESNIISMPGSFKKHYSPNKKLYIGNVNKLININKNKKIGILCFNKKNKLIDKKLQIVLSKKSSLKEASKNLYSSLYLLDNMEIDIILTTLLPNKSIGKSINDKIIKSGEIYE
jgi:L-threonylcarbamoyladenylate synthase